MVQQLSEDDLDWRIEFCEWAKTKVNKDANLWSKTDEANVYVNREVNWQNPEWVFITPMYGNVFIDASVIIMMVQQDWIV